MKHKILAKKLFRIGARAAKEYLERNQSGYICPLCLRLAEDTADLSVEHAPPLAIGGSPVCLTCKVCNNTAGSTIDAAAVERKEIEEIFRKGTRKKYVQLHLDDLVVNAKVSLGGGRADLQIASHNNPNTVAKFKLAAQRCAEKTLYIRYKNKFREQDAMVSYLKAAYLCVFAKLGYAYILRPPLEQVREQIKNPNKEVIWKWWLLRKDGIESDKILICTHPISCVVVAIDRHMIVLPPVNGPYDQYERIKLMTHDTSVGAPLGEWSFSQSFPLPTTMEMLGDAPLTIKLAVKLLYSQLTKKFRQLSRRG